MLEKIAKFFVVFSALDQGVAGLVFLFKIPIPFLVTGINSFFRTIRGFVPVDSDNYMAVYKVTYTMEVVVTIGYLLVVGLSAVYLIYLNEKKRIV